MSKATAIVNGIYQRRAYLVIGSHYKYIPGDLVNRMEAWGEAIPGQAVVLSTTTEALPLPDVAAESLIEWQAASKAASGWIFDVGYGQPFEPSTACNKKLKPALRQALGLPADAPIEESWHWLRHTLATLADEAGMSDAQRQQILRHSTAGMTRRYTHPDWAALADGLNKVGWRVAGEEAKVVEFRAAK